MVRFSLVAVLALAAGCPRQTSRPDPARATLLAAERHRCARLAARLKAAGARPRLGSLGALPRLGQSQALLALLPHGGRLRRFLLRGGQVRRLPSRELTRVESLVIQVRDRIEHGELDPGPLTPLLRRLHRELLGGVDLQGVRQLLVATDGLLRIAPLHALVSGKREGKPRFLVQDVELVYTSCLAPGPRPHGLEDVTVLVPHYAQGRHRLPGAEREAAEVARVLAGRVKVLRGDAATPERLLQALARGSAVHFAGHGLADLQPGTVPELLFAEDRPPLTLGQLTARPVRSPLVVLAACTTAYPARFRDGKRLWARTGPVEALLAAGAGQVVAASWLVKDRLSAELMRRFYRGLARGEPPARALARGQRELIRRLELPHPRFWAGYALYGRGEALPNGE